MLDDMCPDSSSQMVKWTRIKDVSIKNVMHSKKPLLMNFWLHHLFKEKKGKERISFTRFIIMIDICTENQLRFG